MQIYEFEALAPLSTVAKNLKEKNLQVRPICIWNRNFLVSNLNSSEIEITSQLIEKNHGKLVLTTNAENPLSSKLLKQDFSNVNIGKDITLNEGSTLFIGGPCAIESRAQIIETAESLSSLGVKALRAGAFKPRTSIYSFQGLETTGLEILREAADQFGMSVVTEAKDTSHVDAVIEYSDVIQIGTKSMYVFDLLRRAGESGKPVLLKRGFMTTIKEYMQALDVILATGNQNVIMCERGLRTFETQTRFTLDLAGAAVLRLSSHLPLVIDPSHTTGRRDIVAPLARSSVALGVEGLLVEIHPNPDEALSDREQAFPLGDVPELLSDLRKIAGAVGRTLI